MPILKTNPFKRKQLAITNFIPKKMSVDGQKKIDNSFIKLFTKDLQPFSVVDDIGFREFVNLLNPGYKIPNRHAISKILIPAAYEKCFNEVKEIISNDLDTACMTTDCWTSRNTESYIAITVHFLDSNFVLKSILLSCHSFNETHTSEHLSEQINTTLNTWNLKNKIGLAVSDNAYNVQNALSTLQLKHFGCFAHTLNLIVQSAINKESELINKVKSVCTHFHKSTTANNKFMTYQKNNGIKEPKKILQDISTRWNSTFYMLERFVELETSIRGTLGLLDKAPNGLNPNEWAVIKEFCKVLQPFEEATRAVSGEQYIAASMVIVIAQGLQDVCQQLRHEDYSIQTKGLINNLINGMNDRQNWGILQKSMTLSRCTFLDPRLKNIPFIHNESMKTSIQNNVVELTANIISLDRSECSLEPKPSTSFQSPASVSNEKSFSIWETIDKRVSQAQPAIRTSTARALVEVQRYLEEPILKRNDNPLEWWQKHKYNYPYLSILARKTLCCLGSSVPCERVFSKAGLIITDRRCRLKSKKAQMLLFLNQNS